MATSTFHQDYQLLIRLIKKNRQQLGVTQVELAARLGNTQTFVSKMERGERRLDIIEFIESCEALGIAPCELLRQFLEQRKQLHGVKPVALKISKKSNA
ncbi:MAG: helix-turn-helix domain-containing protein [Sinobacteraceae bacterium]|nr:helix-turn-helix domain-containing protein [Nevskiaceae bacterium]